MRYEWVMGRFFIKLFQLGKHLKGMGLMHTK